MKTMKTLGRIKATMGCPKKLGSCHISPFGGHTFKRKTEYLNHRSCLRIQWSYSETESSKDHVGDANRNGWGWLRMIEDAPGWTYRMLCVQNVQRILDGRSSGLHGGAVESHESPNHSSRFEKSFPLLEARRQTSRLHCAVCAWWFAWLVYTGLSPSAVCFFHLLFSLVLRLFSDCLPPSCQTCQGFSDCLLPRLHKLGKNFRQMPPKTGQAKQLQVNSNSRNRSFIYPNW